MTMTAAEPTRYTPEPVLRVRDVAIHLNCVPETVYTLIHDGHLRAIRLGRSFRIPESALADFIAGRRVKVK